jgi:hypothetical protein
LSTVDILSAAQAYDLKVRRDHLRTTGESWDQLAEHGEIGGGHTRDDDVISGPSQHGTSAAYLVARLKRDAPRDALTQDQAANYFPAQK